MGRSVKKGPYVQPVLLKRIQQMNEAGEKRTLSKHGAEHPLFSQISLVIQLQYTMAVNMFRCM